MTARREPAIPSEPGAAADWPRFFLVCGVVALTQAGYYLTTAALPLYLKDLGAAESRIGAEVGLGSVAGLAVTLVLGPALNRYGPRVFLAGGALFYSVAAIGMLTFQNETAVVTFRALQGMGTGLVLPSAYTLGAELLPGRQVTAIGLLGTLTTAALAAGPPIGLALYTQHGAAWLFLPAAAASVVGLVSTAFIRGGGVSEPASGFGFDWIWTPSLLTNTLLAVYFGGLLSYLPLYLRELNGPNAGLFFTADACGVLLLRAPAGVLSERFGTTAPKLIGTLLTVPGIAALALPPSLLTLLCAGLLTGIGAGLTVTAVMGDLAMLSEASNRGTAMSLGAASFSAGIFSGGAISGLLVGPGGFDAVLAFGIATTIAAVPFALGLGFRRSRVELLISRGAHERQT